jgi:AcrR family transcriptional regulator
VNSQPRSTSRIEGAKQPNRGRPRSEKARIAILHAATELLLEHGLGDVSMDEIAEHAGVSKATIYRRWRTKELLALDALYADWDTSRDATPDTGSVRGDLLALLRPWIRRARSRPYGRVISALLTAANTDAEFGDQYRARFVEPRRRAARAVLERGIDRGELPAKVDVEVGLDVLYGPLYHRLLHGHGSLNDRFVTAVVDTCLQGLGSAPRTHDSRNQHKSSGVSRASQ